MHTERAADASDLQEHVDEFGPGGQQFTELIQDDQQGGQRLKRCPRHPCSLIGADIGEVAAGAQEFLTAE